MTPWTPQAPLKASNAEADDHFGLGFEDRAQEVRIVGDDGGGPTQQGGRGRDGGPEGRHEFVESRYISVEW